MEFDTVSETFIANHQPLKGFGATPQASPDGRYIVMFANDGGNNLRVLRAGSNGEASSVAFDVTLDFANVPPGREAISDFAFVQWRNHDLLALASGYDNELALVDLSSTPPSLTKLRLSNSKSPTGGNGGRMVEWAYGTDYLWVDASDAEEIYVVGLSEDGNVANATVERTIRNIPSNKIIYVENFAQRSQVTFLRQVLMSDNPGTSGAADDVAQNTVAAEVRSQLEQEGLYLDRSGSSISDDDYPSTVAIVGLVLGIVSVLTNMVLLFFLFAGVPLKEHNSTKTESEEVARSPDDEVKTLGSKQVA